MCPSTSHPDKDAEEEKDAQAYAQADHVDIHPLQIVRQPFPRITADTLLTDGNLKCNDVLATVRSVA